MHVAGASSGGGLAAALAAAAARRGVELRSLLLDCPMLSLLGYKKSQSMPMSVCNAATFQEQISSFQMNRKNIFLKSIRFRA